LRDSVEGEVAGVRRLSSKNLSGWERLSNLLQGGGSWQLRLSFRFDMASMQCCYGGVVLGIWRFYSKGL
jgi:hypothetical protein